MTVPLAPYNPVCPHCGEPAALTYGGQIYRITPALEHLRKKKFWHCAACDAYCGCHPPTAMTGGRDDVPLGTLANKALREARKRAHAAFDPLWKDEGLSRTTLYKMLAEHMRLPPEQCHIAMFDAAQCRAVVEWVRSR